MTREYLKDEQKKCGKTLKELQQILGSYMTSHYFTNGKEFSFPSKEAYQKLQSTGYFQKPYEELKALYQSERPVKEGNSENICYYPQGLKKVNWVIKEKGSPKSGYIGMKKKEYIQEYTNYPTNVLEFDAIGTNLKAHTSEKPQLLLEYLIKTYTKEGETVLDNTMGSGSTGLACLETKRNFIGYELNDKFFKIAEKRLKEREIDIERRLFECPY